MSLAVFHVYTFRQKKKKTLTSCSQHILFYHADLTMIVFLSSFWFVNLNMNAMKIIQFYTLL